MTYQIQKYAGIKAPELYLESENFTTVRMKLMELIQDLIGMNTSCTVRGEGKSIRVSYGNGCITNSVTYVMKEVGE